MEFTAGWKGGSCNLTYPLHYKSTPPTLNPCLFMLRRAIVIQNFLQVESNLDCCSPTGTSYKKKLDGPRSVF